MDDAGAFFNGEEYSRSTYLALRWHGRVRYIVPRERAGQRACWEVFEPGGSGIQFRAKAMLPQVFGASGCVESRELKVIRDAIGNKTGLSSCRRGAAGPWSKDTILLLDEKTSEPEFIVKAATGNTVNNLLENEAAWLGALHGEPSLNSHVPELVVQRTGAGLSYVGQRILSGERDFRLGPIHFAFLRKLQDYSTRTMRFGESKLYRTIISRMKELAGLLSREWLTRLQKAIAQIEASFSGEPMLHVASHNDFNPWNIRLNRGQAYVFDWEYADYEQLPLFDPLHFVLMPMSLRRQTVRSMARQIHETTKLCEEHLGDARCYRYESQAVSYLVNLCTLYLSAERGKTESNAVLESYGRLLDVMCST
jgi:hypothetical protein